MKIAQNARAMARDPVWQKSRREVIHGGDCADDGLRQPTRDMSLPSVIVTNSGEGCGPGVSCNAPPRPKRAGIHCGLVMVVTQKPTQSLAAPHRLRAARLRDARKQQGVGLSLMISLSVVVSRLRDLLGWRLRFRFETGNAWCPVHCRWRPVFTTVAAKSPALEISGPHNLMPIFRNQKIERRSQ
jgi:hypothetical protein